MSTEGVRAHHAAGRGIANAGRLATGAERQQQSGSDLGQPSPFKDASPFLPLVGGDHFRVAADAAGCLASWGHGKARCLGHGDQNNVKKPLWIRG